MGDRRLVCGECGVKWFIPSDRPRPDTPVRCASCGGTLIVLLPAAARPPGWSAQREPDQHP